MLTVGIIGAGNMASAMIGGLTGTLASEVFLTVWDKELAKCRKAADVYGVKAGESIAEIVDSDIVMIAVKPQHVAGVLAEIAPLVRENQLIISVAAGVKLAFYREKLPQACIVRAMPNTSATVLHSMTGLMSEQKISNEQHDWVEFLFGAIGRCLWIDEKQVDALTAVSGSGPAYFYYFTEVMAQVGADLGLDEEIAQILARETMIGAGKMLAASREIPADLRRSVTSPNGTTEQAIHVLKKTLPDALDRAMSACARRSSEMAEEFGK